MFCFVLRLLIAVCLCLQCAVDNTWSGDHSGMSVSLDNKIAMASAEKSARDPHARNFAVSQVLFVQVFKQLAHKPPASFRRRYDDRGTLFKVSFADEPGIDAGGLFRDCMSSIVDDLFSPHLDLFLLCPNGRLDQVTRCARV